MVLSRQQKTQRILMMIFGAFAIFFTGYPHVWSIYQPYVMEQAGWTQGQASMCFYLALCVFVFGNIIGGRLMDRRGMKPVLFLGGGLYSAGVLLSAMLIVPNPLPIYLTYGVMQGLGQGMAYTAILSTAQTWFPGRTGFASGVVVTANGLCGLFLAPISRTLLERFGPAQTFLAIGAVMAFSWVLSCIFVKAPDAQLKAAMEMVNKSSQAAGTVEVQYQYTSAEMIRTKKFYFLLATMLFGLFSYFFLSPVSQTLQIEQGIPASIAVSAVMIGSTVNACTRLVLPTLADKIGRAPCVKGVLAVAIAAMVILTVSGSYMTTVAVILMYGCYGGIMGSFPSFTSSIFGLEHTGENYGFVMFGVVGATLGAPALTSLITGMGYSMNAVFALGAVFAVIAFVSLILLQRELKGNKKEKKERAICL